MGSHEAVEDFQNKARILVAECREGLAGAQEMAIRADLHRQAEAGKLFAHPPVARFEHDQALRVQLGSPAPHLTRECAEILGIVELAVEDAASRVALFIAEM